MKVRLPTDGRRLLALNTMAGGAANIAKIGVQLVMLPLMARLLGPAEFGLYALALPAVAFFTVLADGGLGMSLAREEEASTDTWSSAFWLLLATCTVIALAVTGLGFLLAAASDQPRLRGLMALLSLSFPLMAVSALPAARLVRRGNLVLHSAGDVVSTFIGAAVALALAVLGAGAWSLAIQYVVGFVVRALIFNAAAFERPAATFRFAAIWPHVATGGSVIGSRLAEFCGRALENLSYSHTFGGPALGAFTLANQTARFLCDAAGNPLWGSLYAHALQEDAHSVRSLHLKLTRLLALVLFPAAALLTASAPHVFALALGPQWSASTALLQVLLPFYALNTVAGQGGAILIANGRSAALFWALGALSLGRLASVMAGSWTETAGVVWGIGASNALFAIGMFGLAGRTTGTRPAAQLRVLVAPGVASLVAGIACHTLIAPHAVDAAWTMLGVGAGGCVYVACLLLLEGRRLISDASALQRVVFPKKSLVDEV